MKFSGLTISGLALGGALLLWAGMGSRADDSQMPKLKAPTAQETEFFETNVRPVLFEKCFSCHGEKTQQGGLRLDSRAAILKGGGNGPAIVAGDPDKSLLIKAVNYTGALKMPPAGKLKPVEIAALTDWVRMGAPWPEGKASRAPDKRLPRRLLPGDQHWSFRPVKKTAPPKVKNTAG